jgi:hypothetical protein
VPTLGGLWRAEETILAGSRNLPSQIFAEQYAPGCSQEIKSDVTQIKDLHFSDIITKVQHTSILPKFLI